MAPPRTARPPRLPRKSGALREGKAACSSSPSSSQAREGGAGGEEEGKEGGGSREGRGRTPGVLCAVCAPTLGRQASSTRCVDEHLEAQREKGVSSSSSPAGCGQSRVWAFVLPNGSGAGDRRVARGQSRRQSRRQSTPGLPARSPRGPRESGGQGTPTPLPGPRFTPHVDPGRRPRGKGSGWSPGLGEGAVLEFAPS